MFKTHRKINFRLKLENFYSIYIFSQFFLTFMVLFYFILSNSDEKSLFIEALTIVIGILTYFDITIRMRAKRYFLKSLWGILELVIITLLTIIILNFLLRLVKKRFQITDSVLGNVPYFAEVFLPSTKVLPFLPEVSKHSKRSATRYCHQNRRLQ